MKRKIIFSLILSVFFLSGCALANDQKENFDHLWQNIDELMAKNLPQSAMKTLDSLHDMAITSHNDVQLVKSIQFRFRLIEMTEEDHLEKSIAYTLSELNKAESPTKQWLHSIVAELYVFYYQQHRYEWLSRTNQINNTSDDLKEWDLAKLRETILFHYEQSITESDKLKEFSLGYFKDALLNTEKESIDIQPTVYDFLAQRLIDFYLNDDAGLHQTTAKPAFNEEKAFTKASDFVKLQLPESNYPKAKALQTIQQLMKFHLNDKNQEAFFRCDLKRLEIASQLFDNHTVNFTKYLEALEHLQSKFASQAFSTEAAALRASKIIDDNYNTESQQDTTKRWNRSKALKICNEAISSFPTSRGAMSCNVIKNQILDTVLSIQVQNVELPGKPIPVYLTYQNITEINFRLIKTNSKMIDRIEEMEYNQDRNRELLKLKPTKSWSVSIPFEADYETHTTILQIPASEKGIYILLASADKDFKPQNLITYTNFQLSKLSFIHQRSEEKNTIFVLDRETGKTIKNAGITLKSKEYNYNSRKYKEIEIGHLTSGKDGKVEIASTKDQNARNFSIEIQQQGDTLWSNNHFNSYRYEHRNDKNFQTFIFTDRAIYRPGQTIYFKGIKLATDENSCEIIPNEKINISFLDANWEEISSTNLSTNDFGSFEGSFTIPVNRLNGNFTLRTNYGSASIQVEEYKRPAFEVKIDLPSSQYTLNETVTLNGKAMAFAGFGIDQAKYSYRIERGQNFPFWRYWCGFPPYGDEKTIIASGEAITNADGSFSIDCKLLSDENTNQFDPVYNYTITVDVTDRNGETRSGTQTLYASNKALIISTNLQKEIPLSDLGKFMVTVENLQGRGSKANVELLFSRFEDETAVIRENSFPSPDRKILSDNELASFFPDDNFYKITDPTEKSKQLVYQYNIEVDSITKLFPEFAKGWQQGEWFVEMNAKDAYGREVKYQETFTLFDDSSNALAVKLPDWTYISNTSAEPGEILEFQFGTSYKNLPVLTEISANNRLISRQWITVSDGKIRIPYLVKEEDRGDIRCTFTTIRNNRLINNTLNVNIPFTNKNLHISLETKRDRLVPGSKENWTVTIADKNKSKITAELLAGMYDASLDAFKPHDWSFHPLPHLRHFPVWNADNGFGSAYTSQLWHPQIRIDYPNPIQNPGLNWFGFSSFSLDGFALRDKGVFASGMEFTASKAKQDEEISLTAEEDASINQKDVSVTDKTPKVDQTPVLRSNLNETAFFFPQLKTREDGTVQFDFQLPDALTRWKLMLLAHTKDLKTGNTEYTFTASKDVMIMPNLPRFFREGDTVILQAKVVNTAGKKISGSAKLSFIIDGSESDSYNYLLDKNIISFESIETAQSTSVSWKFVVPSLSEPITLRFSATSGDFTDSEQHMVPVLPRKTLVTESLVLNTSANSSKTFKFKPLDSKLNYSTERLEVQIVSNPSWYAIQALPYLEEEMYNNAESIFIRYYANTLASIIAAQIPDAMEVIRQWKVKNQEELQSELAKNEHLKTVLLQETPWVMEAKAESEQKQRISLLFDINRMQYETNNSLKKLLEQQTVNGAWSWFPGMPESEYITNRIVTGIGKLNKLSGTVAEKPEFAQMTGSAIRFLDEEMLKDYSALKKEGKLPKYSLSSEHLNYLYMRSFFVQNPMNDAVNEGFNFILTHLETGWKSFDKGQQAMASVTLHRFGKEKAAKAILASLLEYAIKNADIGMYWKYATSYYWYTAPVESQSLIINAFDEIGGYSKEVDQMRTWLLSQKQTHRWVNSSATVEAIYALLLRGNDWIHHTKPVQLKVGDEIIETEKGAGQSTIFTKVWNAEKINPRMQEIEISNPNPSMSWGSAFRQYFADIDRVQSSNGQVSITKELFIKQTGPNGFEIVPVSKKEIKVGDKVVVRLILIVDRDMEYVHLKDQRAAAFEPKDIISSYHFEGGLGYYQSTRDASTDFFFDHLRKGKYVFEYELTAFHSGDFSNGRAILECFYAPSFSAHSKSGRIAVTR